MADEPNKQSSGEKNLSTIAGRSDNHRPTGVKEREWRKARIAAGHMVLIRSHFKSIYLVPMAIISVVCGIATVLGHDSGWARGWGLVWTFSFMFYMNIFIFEWNRVWTVVLFGGMVTALAVGFAVNSDAFPVWRTMADFVKNLNLAQNEESYFFYGIFFAICSMVSWIKTRMHYVVIERNEMQIYRNAFFGDRRRISMLNPSIEVKVPDMVEYFHPFYRAGTVVIRPPGDETIVLENVLGIRNIERVTDRLGSSLSVRIEEHSTPPVA